jgi:hypothetical protein
MFKMLAKTAKKPVKKFNQAFLHVLLAAAPGTISAQAVFPDGREGGHLKALSTEEASMSVDFSLSFFDNNKASMSIDISLSFLGTLNDIKKTSKSGKISKSKVSKAGTQRPSNSPTNIPPSPEFVPSPMVNCPTGYICLQNDDFRNEDQTRYKIDLSIEANTIVNSPAYRTA